MKKLLLIAVLLTFSCGHGQKKPDLSYLEGRHRVHVVQRGETTYAIAREHGVSYEQLVRLNRLEDPAQIYPGQRLYLPGLPPETAKQLINVEKPATATVTKVRTKTKLVCDLTARAPPKSATGFIWPVDGVVISRFGRREGDPHLGIDIASPTGTTIWASLPGEVVFAGEQKGYGKLVIIQHDEERVTVYAHNARNCVAEGTRVARGDVIGLVGQTGGALSPYVHFEVRVGQKPRNPRKFLP